MTELESLYDRNDHFKYDVVKEIYKVFSYNLNPNSIAQEVFIRSGCTLDEKEGLIERFKKYKDVFACNYGDLKGF